MLRAGVKQLLLLQGISGQKRCFPLHSLVLLAGPLICAACWRRTAAAPAQNDKQPFVQRTARVCTSTCSVPLDPVILLFHSTTTHLPVRH